MANRHEPHAANLDTEGTQAVRGVGVTQAQGATVPTDGTAGYATGCIFQVTSGSVTVSTVLYVNIGNAESCNFDPLTG